MELQKLIETIENQASSLKGELDAYEHTFRSSFTKDQLKKYQTEQGFQNSAEFLTLPEEQRAFYILGFSKGIELILTDMDNEQCEFSNSLRSRKRTYHCDGALIAIDFAQSVSFDVNELKRRLEEKEQNLVKFAQTGEPQSLRPGSSVRSAQEGFMEELRYILRLLQS